MKTSKTVGGSAALCALLAAVAAGFWLKDGSKAKLAAASERRNGNLLAPTISEGQKESAQRAAKVVELRRYWAEHRKYLRHLLRVDYPAALARWQAAKRQREQAVAFGLAYEADFKRRNQAALAQWQERNPDGAVWLQQSPVRGVLLGPVFVRAAEDGTSITADFTFRQMYRQLLASPTATGDLRGIVAEAERLAFGDEDAARQVEGLPTSEAVLTYLQTACTRYAAKATAVLEEAGFDVPSRDLLPDMMYAEAVVGATASYGRNSDGELQTILREYDRLIEKIDAVFLAQESADDSESRRLLTEWKTMQILRENVAREQQAAEKGD